MKLTLKEIYKQGTRVYCYRVESGYIGTKGYVDLSRKERPTVVFDRVTNNYSNWLEEHITDLAKVFCPTYIQVGTKFQYLNTVSQSFTNEAVLKKVPTGFNSTDGYVSHLNGEQNHQVGMEFLMTSFLPFIKTKCPNCVRANYGNY